MAAADAPPNSKAEIREGRTRYDANSGGNEDADSSNDLHATFRKVRVDTRNWIRTAGAHSSLLRWQERSCPVPHTL